MYGIACVMIQLAFHRHTYTFKWPNLEGEFYEFFLGNGRLITFEF